MAIEVVEYDNIVDLCAKYKVTCPKCGAVIEYLGRDVSFHGRFPKGFIRCPKCRNLIAHEKENFTGEILDEKDIIREEKRQSKNTIVMCISIGAAIALLIFITIMIICAIQAK